MKWTVVKMHFRAKIFLRKMLILGESAGTVQVISIPVYIFSLCGFFPSSSPG